MAGVSASDGLLTPSRIQFTDEALDWRSAVRMVGRPLVEEGAVSAAYPEAAIEIAEARGPFFDLGRQVAMPHARPEAGANMVALSFLRCRQPVLLLDREDHPIEVFIMLASPDDKSHLKVMRTLAGVLVDPDSVERLKRAVSADEVLDVFKAG